MRYRIDVVRKDSSGVEFSRSMIGEYELITEAMRVMKMQEGVLKTIGTDDTCVEMTTIYDKPKRS